MVQLAADYNEEPYDCTIMDDDMPHMQGSEATKILRGKGFSDLRVIGLTGNRDDAHLQHFRDCGADIVIRKPLTEALWLRIYNSLLKEENFTVV
jgi:CheY-like chemotaxis protein